MLKRIVIAKRGTARPSFCLLPQAFPVNDHAMMETLGDWMSRPQSVWLLAGILIVFAVVGAARFEMTMKRCRIRIGKARKALKTVKNAREFAAAYDATCASIRGGLATDELFVTTWEAYHGGLLVADKSVSSPRPAEDFFQASNVFQRPAILWYRNLPGMLVGLGLVCTFLGIAVVIHQASTALTDASDPSALRTLLSAAALKFWTSLTGVGLSIVCAHHGRARLQGINLSLKRLARELNALAPVAGQQSVLAELKRLRLDIGTVAETAMTGLLEQASGVLQEAVKDSIGSIAGAVEGLSGDLSHLRENLHGIAAQILKASGSLENATAALESVVGDSGKRLRDDFSGACDSAATARESFAGMAADAVKAGKTVNKLAAIADQVKAAVDGLAKLNGVPEKLAATGDSLRKSAVDLATLWAGYSGKIEGLDRQLASTLTSLPAVFKEYSTALGTYTQGLDEHLDTTLVRLMEWVQRIEQLQRAAITIDEAEPAALDAVTTKLIPLPRNERT